MAGKYIQVIVCFIPDLSLLSVIQECQGTSQKTSSLLLWKHLRRHLLQLAAPSRVCFFLQLPSVLLGLLALQAVCSAAAPQQPASSPTRLTQVFQLCNSVQNGICHSVLFVQGCMVNSKQGLAIQHLGSILRYFFIHVFAVCQRLYYIFCY